MTDMNLSTKFYSIPVDDIRKLLNEAVVATELSVFGQPTTEIIKTTWRHGILSTLPTVTVYQRLPENLFDKWFSRRRYKLIYIHNQLMGSVNKGNLNINMIDSFNTNIDHLDIKYKYQKELYKLFEGK